MSAASSAVIVRQAAQGDGKPSVTYRFAGDRAVLIEYGEMVFDLALNFFVLAAGDALAAGPPEGLIETAPGFRSMLVSYYPAGVSTAERVCPVRGRHADLRPEPGVTSSTRLR